MHIDFEVAVAKLTQHLPPYCIVSTARRAIWLEACGYSGLGLLAEALTDKRHELDLQRGPLGLDLQNVSCVFLAEKIQRDVAERGRVFLRNVRHGLYLLQDSAEQGYAIGCPVDPGFALGGERTGNPYREKVEQAKKTGLNLDADIWRALVE